MKYMLRGLFDLVVFIVEWIIVLFVFLLILSIGDKIGLGGITSSITSFVGNIVGNIYNVLAYIISAFTDGGDKSTLGFLTCGIIILAIFYYLDEKYFFKKWTNKLRKKWFED